MKKKIPALTSVTTARCDPDYLLVTSVTTLDHCHAGKDLHLRVLVQRLRYGAQGPGFQQVVGIHDSDDLVTSGRDCTVHRHVDSRTRRRYTLDMRILRNNDQCSAQRQHTDEEVQQRISCEGLRGGKK